MTHRPEVSVVIPTRHRRGMLELTVASALRQRDVEIEVVIVDDASNHEAILIPGVRDPRVRILREGRAGGVSAARNRGIADSRGEWIAFLDDDDLWAPDKLWRQLEAAGQTGLGWAYAGDVSVDAGLRVVTGRPPLTPKELMAALPRYNGIPSGSSNVIVRANVLARAGPFDPALQRTEDWDMWIRLARLGLPAYANRPLVAYRFHSANIPSESGSIIREPALLAKRYGIPVDRAAMQRRAAWNHLRAGRRARALRHYARAVSMGDIRSLGRAVVALTHPAAGSDRVFGLLQSRPEDEGWRREAQKWLTDLAQDRINRTIP